MTKQNHDSPFNVYIYTSDKQPNIMPMQTWHKRLFFAFICMNTVQTL